MLWLQLSDRHFQDHGLRLQSGFHFWSAHGSEEDSLLGEF